MFLNRHFFILVLSLLFIGAVCWQQPAQVVTAMAGDDYFANSAEVVKQYFKRMDYRQFDLADKMLEGDARSESKILEKRLQSNPFLSLQKIEIENIDSGTCLARIRYGSSIDPQETVHYRVEVTQADIGAIITAIQTIE